MTAVLHHQRVAWDGARAFVRSTLTPDYERFADDVRFWLGPEHFAALEETRERVLTNLYRTGGDRFVPDVEAGRWRARLQDLLAERPDLARTLLDLIAQVPR